MHTTITRSRWRRLAVAALLAGGFTSVTAVGAPAASAGQHNGCVRTAHLSTEPTSTAPSWYHPGVTRFCPADASGEPGMTTAVSYWFSYDDDAGNRSWATSPDNADASADACRTGYTTCGSRIIGDAALFYGTCHDQLGLSAADVATNIHYWADRARANGYGWMVHTWAEPGGYPYSCQFSAGTP